MNISNYSTRVSNTIFSQRQENLSGHFNFSYKLINICAIVIPKRISPNNIISIEITGERSRFDIRRIMYFPIDIIKLFEIKETNDHILIIIDNTYNNLIPSFLYDFFYVYVHATEEFGYQLMASSFDLKSDISYSKNIKLISNTIKNLKNKCDDKNILGIYIITQELIKVLKINGYGMKLQYDEITICYYNNLKQVRPSWTRKQELMLIFSLNKILPIEIINIIKEYITKDKHTEYVYYFPFEREIQLYSIELNCDPKRMYYVYNTEIMNN